MERTLFILQLMRYYHKISKLKSFNSFLKSLLTVLLLVIIAVGLINTETFYSPNAFAYYGFFIITLVFVIISSFFNSTNNVIHKTPLLLFGFWCCYVLFHYFTNTGTLIFTVYSIVLFLLLFKATLIFSTPNFNFKLFFIGIVVIASVESLYCVGQFLGWITTQNQFFVITGTLNNPNITAIFLALTTPVFLFLLKGKNKKVLFSGFLMVLVALLLLKCRAAFIGIVLSAAVFFSLEYNLLRWIKDKKNRTSAKAILILILLIIIPLSSQLYNAKKASADGRKFIWKLSAQMSTQKPLTGYGYGFFEKEYNLFQADFIKKGKATAEELENARPTVVAHNELFQNTVEGGFIGLVLISLFFGTLLFSLKQRKKSNTDDIHNNITEVISIKEKDAYFHLSYAAVIGFIAMSMFEFTIQVIPVMALFIIYAAIICSSLDSIKLTSKLYFIENNKFFSIGFKILLPAISLYLLYLIIGIANADLQNKKASLLKRERHYEEALKIMPALNSYLKEDSDYWKNYGTIYLGMKQYSKALHCLEKAKKWSSLPELYQASGYCYYQLQNYPQAINEYETLIVLHPTKFLYRMTLLQAYLKNKDKSKAIHLAQEIIQLKPKVPSEKVNRYKNSCRDLLRKLGVENTNNGYSLIQKQSQLIFK